jgi:hypothetical protein
MPRSGGGNQLRNVWRSSNPSDVSFIDGDTMLNQDFREFLELLARHDVRYLIVGGYSVLALLKAYAELR